MAAWVIPAIGAAVSALGSIFGGNQASKAMKRAKRGVQQQMDENEDWYNRRYNEDATQRADAQRVLTLTEDAIRKRNRAAAGTQAVMGGNEASVAAQREVNSQATAEAAARIAAAGESRKDRIEESYRNRKQNLQDQLNSIEVGKAQNTAQAIQGVTSAAGNAMMNLGGGNSIWDKGGYKKYQPGKMPWADATMNKVDLAAGKNITNGYIDQLAKQNGWG